DFNKAPAQKVASHALESIVPPVEGTVITSFSAAHPGIVVRTKKAAEIVAMGTGRVIFSGETAPTGITVMIQHAGGIQSIYGHLSGTSVKENDWVEAGHPIGSPTESGGGGKVYLALRQD